MNSTRHSTKLKTHKKAMKTIKLKTTTKDGDFHITPLGMLHTDGYQITHHAQPTQIARDIDELLSVVGYDEYKDGNLDIKLIAANDRATLVFWQDNRHGIDGWRASRYIYCPEKPNVQEWDENYLFFPTLHEGILAACQKGEEAKTAIHEAYQRF